MHETMPFVFPELYSQRKRFKLIPPPSYICERGHGSKKITTESLNCGVCGSQLQRSTLYGVFKRMVSGQIKEEDFVLQLVKNNPRICKSNILSALAEEYPNSINASEPLKYLTYYGYLKTEAVHFNGESILLYTLNEEKDLLKRSEANVR